MHVPREDDAEVEASVEAVLDLSEVTMGAFDEIEGMVGAAGSSLQVAQHSVDKPPDISFIVLR